MGCNCNKPKAPKATTAAGVPTPQAKYRLTLPDGISFPDTTSRSKDYIVRSDADLANRTLAAGRGTVTPVT